MKKIEYVTPAIKTKGFCPSYLMAGSGGGLNPDDPADGLGDGLGNGGDDPGDFSKENDFGSVWED